MIHKSVLKRVYQPIEKLMEQLGKVLAWMTFQWVTPLFRTQRMILVSYSKVLEKRRGGMVMGFNLSSNHLKFCISQH